MALERSRISKCTVHESGLLPWLNVFAAQLHSLRVRTMIRLVWVSLEPLRFSLMPSWDGGQNRPNEVQTSDATLSTRHTTYIEIT